MLYTYLLVLNLPELGMHKYHQAIQWPQKIAAVCILDPNTKWSKFLLVHIHTKFISGKQLEFVFNFIKHCFCTLCVSTERLVTPLTLKSKGGRGKPASSIKAIINPPRQASTWTGISYFRPRAAISPTGSKTPCGYPGADANSYTHKVRLKINLYPGTKLSDIEFYQTSISRDGFFHRFHIRPVCFRIYWYSNKAHSTQQTDYYINSLVKINEVNGTCIAARPCQKLHDQMQAWEFLGVWYLWHYEHSLGTLCKPTVKILNLQRSSKYCRY